MKKIAFTAIASLSVLALSACGKSEDPNAVASADNAEMPAEESVNSAEASAIPVADKAGEEAKDEAGDAEGPKTPSEVKDAAAQTAKEFEDAGKEDEAAPKQ